MALPKVVTFYYHGRAEDLGKASRCMEDTLSYTLEC